MDRDASEIIGKMLRNKPTSDFKKEWTLNLASLWSKYGSKKFLGRKGMKEVRKNMQDTYVMISMESDEVKRLKLEIAKIKDSKEDTDIIKFNRASDELSVRENRLSELHLRYKFLSSIYSIQDLAKGTKFIKKIDSTLKKKSNLEILEKATKDSLMNRKEIERNLESMEVYLDVMKDGKTEGIRDPEENDLMNLEEKEEKDREEDEDGDVMTS